MIDDDNILDKDGGTYSHRNFVTLIGIKTCFKLWYVWNIAFFSNGRLMDILRDILYNGSGGKKKQ